MLTIVLDNLVRMYAQFNNSVMAEANDIAVNTDFYLVGSNLCFVYTCNIM